MENFKNLSINNIKLKVEFYFISLWFLFVLIIILTLKLPIKPFTFKSLFIANWLAFIALLLTITCLCVARKILYNWKGTLNPPTVITDINNENFEYLTFLTTYIIPLICIDFTSIRYLIIFSLILIVVGIIFTRTDLYYGNPTLALLGYRLYKVKIINEQKEIILITKDKLSNNSHIKWKPIDTFVWVAKECKKDLNDN